MNTVTVSFNTSIGQIIEIFVSAKKKQPHNFFDLWLINKNICHIQFQKYFAKLLLCSLQHIFRNYFIITRCRGNLAQAVVNYGPLVMGHFQPVKLLSNFLKIFK